MKKLVISQPGKLGDILITAPMAKYYYDAGYEEIHWPVFDNFKGILERFPYVKPVLFGVSLDSKSYLSDKRVSFYDKSCTAGIRSAQFYQQFYSTYLKSPEFEMLDACFAFPGHRNDRNNQHGSRYIQENKSWIQLKYDLAEVPLKNRWKLEYTREEGKEEKLLEFIRNYSKQKYGSYEYSIVQRYQSSPIRPLPHYEAHNPIIFSYIDGYEIVDWLRVLEEASEIVCVDSCLTHFVEVSPSLKEVKKVYLGTEEPHYIPFMSNILFNNWINLSSADISYGVESANDL